MGMDDSPLPQGYPELPQGHPVKHGVVTNWDDMETVWRHLFSALNVTGGSDDDDADRLSETPALITEAPLNPKSTRDKMGELVFEKLGLPAVLFAIPAVLSLFASGRQSGLVVDCGHDLTHVVSVNQGQQYISINLYIRDDEFQ